MPFVTYSLLRLGLVLASMGLLWLIGVRHWILLVAFGVVIGAALSYLLLRRQRDATAAYLQHRVESRKESREDEDVEDALTGEDAPPEGTPREA